MRDEHSRRQLLVRVDRLDYSKGLPQRLLGFRELLERYPENRSRATLIQIPAPSREDVDAYGEPPDLRYPAQACSAPFGLLAPPYAPYAANANDLSSSRGSNALLKVEASRCINQFIHHE